MLILGVVVMHIDKNLNITKILGSENKYLKPNFIFEELIISFLNEIYLSINKIKEARLYSDLATFGFWCRKKNIENLLKKYKNNEIRIGRGIVYHIAPSNVPMNFAYSFAFGMLSGNYNLVRLPSKKYYQIHVLCDIIRKICSKKKYKKILKYFLFIHYEKSSKISNYLSSQVDARLIWGGDETIKEFKKYDTHPRCVDLNFANRISFSIIRPSALKKLSNMQYLNFIKNFFNDSYLMDQRGCSAPKLILWFVDNKNQKKDNQAIEKFWNDLDVFVKSNYEDDLSITNKKITSLFYDTLNSGINYTASYKSFNIVRLKINSLSNNIERMNNSYGTFIEKNISSIDSISKIVTKRFQTLTYFGVDNKKIISTIKKNGILGIDRIVKVGRANDLDAIWDGYDIINSLSRIVSN